MRAFRMTVAPQPASPQATGDLRRGGRPLRHLLRCLPLLLFCHAACAQWDMLGRNEELRLFMDRTPVQRDGDIVTVWQLTDYTRAQWVDHRVIMSVRHLVEYDCVRRLTRTVAAAGFSEQMGFGARVAAESRPDAEWMALPAGGSAETLWRAACGG